MRRQLIALLLLLVLPIASVSSAPPPQPMIIVLRDQHLLRKNSPVAAPADPASVWRSLNRTAAETQRPLLDLLSARHISARSFTIINAIAAPLDATTIAQLRGHPAVAAIYPDAVLRGVEDTPAIASSAAPDAATWGIIDIRADQVWSSYGITGSGVVVAGNDTGIAWQHPALLASYRGWDGSTATHTYNWHDGITQDINGGGNPCGFAITAPCDDNGHGTHTLGTMVGLSGANQVGVAPGARWVGCRNMEAGDGRISTYLSCFEWFLAPTDSNGQNPRPDLAPHIINNSWSCVASEGCDSAATRQLLEPAVNNLTSAGILVVGSAGNTGPSCGSMVNPPSIYPATVSTGSYDSNGQISSSSGRGPITYNGVERIGPTLSAPGVSVYSTRYTGDYTTMSGTSMASPHVAGAVALLWSAQPTLRGQITPTLEILHRSARPALSTLCGPLAPDGSNNTYGWGKLDALAAVALAVTPTLQISVTEFTSGQPLTGTTISVTGPITLALETEDAQLALGLPPGSYTVISRSTQYGDVRATITISAATLTNLELIHGLPVAALPIYLPLLHR